MIRIGPAGWAYKDWNGVVYPARRPRGFHELTFIAGLFDMAEINTSFYRPVSPQMSTAWLDQVAGNDRFRFTAKLWRGFTHLRNGSSQDEQLIKTGLGPLLESGRLGALLLQFPWSFRNDTENRAYVVNLRDRFREFPLVLEVRHSSWSEPSIFALLEELNIGLCNIDQPLFQRSVKPGAAVTSAVGYVRLHGRNYRSWFTESTYHGERYDYLYSPSELDPWIDRIKEVDHAAAETYVVTNNHYLGKAVVNGLELTSVLQERSITLPASLVAVYPELRAFAPPEEAKGMPGDQLNLLPE